jgi:hypothetical protein
VGVRGWLSSGARAAARRCARPPRARARAHPVRRSCPGSSAASPGGRRTCAHACMGDRMGHAWGAHEGSAGAGRAHARACPARACPRLRGVCPRRPEAGARGAPGPAQPPGGALRAPRARPARGAHRKMLKKGAAGTDGGDGAAAAAAPPRSPPSATSPPLPPPPAGACPSAGLARAHRFMADAARRGPRSRCGGGREREEGRTARADPARRVWRWVCRRRGRPIEWRPGGGGAVEAGARRAALARLDRRRAAMTPGAGRVIPQPAPCGA